MLRYSLKSIVSPSLNISKRYFFAKLNKLLTPPSTFIEDVTLWSGQSLVLKEESVIKEWKIFSDKDYGGLSSCNIEIIPDDNDISKSILNFRGIINFNEELMEKTKAKGGFCALRGICKEVQDVRDYEGLELLIRSKTNQIIAFNTTCDTLFQDDLYQLNISLPKDIWCKIHVPFANFRLTAKGNDRELQRSNDSLRLESVGILIRNDALDNVITEFDLDIKEINVIAFIEPRLTRK